mgnify:CR=1 FL=1
MNDKIDDLILKKSKDKEGKEYNYYDIHLKSNGIPIHTKLFPKKYPSIIHHINSNELDNNIANLL